MTSPRVEAYRRLLAASDDPEAVALAHSNLPGPRGNLELIAALAETSAEPAMRRWIALSPAEARGNEPPVVLVVAGTVGLGILLARGRVDVLPLLHDLAADERWRVREGVAMALQRLGETDPAALLDAVEPWVDDRDPLVQRAVVAGLCEPANLRVPAIAARVVAILDRITASLRSRPDRRLEPVRVLRQALGYAWSVAIVAAPVEGRAAFGRLVGVHDPDIAWIVRENLGKARLASAGADWVATMRARSTATRVAAGATG